MNTQYQAAFLSLRVLSGKGVTLSSYGNFLHVDLPACPTRPGVVSMRLTGRGISASCVEIEA